MKLKPYYLTGTSQLSRKDFSLAAVVICPGSNELLGTMLLDVDGAGRNNGDAGQLDCIDRTGAGALTTMGCQAR